MIRRYYFQNCFLPKAVITLAFYLIFILKRAYVQLPFIYTCFHLVIPRTKSSVYVNNNCLLCMKKDRHRLQERSRVMQTEQNRKKGLFKGELNPAKDHNTRDTSFLKTLYFRLPALHMSTKKNPRANFTVIFSSIIFYLSLANLCLFGYFYYILLQSNSGR